MGTLRKFSAVRSRVCLLLSFFLLVSLLTGCAPKGETLLEQAPEVRSAVSKDLHYEKSMELSHAERFAVDYFREGGCLVTASDDRQYFLLPKKTKASVPEDLPEQVTVLRTPLEKGYLSGSASMDFFVACGALDALRYSSLQESAWNIPEASAAMQAGNIQYAGKYSMPDYELLTTGGCGFAVENTMIYHSPDVLEQLEKLGIPVFLDCSSLESSPEGRMEWVKVYGLLTDREVAAEEAFEAQEKEFRKLSKTQDQSSERPTVAYFSILTNGTVNIRLSNDYIVSMIELAGGTYVFDDLQPEKDSNRTTKTISMEEFYRRARTADYFVFNSTIEGERTSIEQLLKEAPVLADCKAVKDARVYCTTADFYQHTMGQGTFVRDLHKMLNGGTGFTYLFQLS